MRRLPVVALVGQTNAGKSSILNRMARRKIAIVAREEGTTRDNVMARIEDAFILVDTAGLKDPEDDFEASIQGQIEDAILSAEVILVVVDATKYPDDRDREIAKRALKSGKPVYLVLNKCDLREALDESEFLRLGIKDIFRISANTGLNIEKLKNFLPKGKMIEENRLKIALIGRPNVGKSSLFNALGRKQQAIVSSKQGTTRDVNRVEVKYKGREMEILDTAGLRRPGKREVGIEKFSAIRTLAAIEEAEVCALLVDATEPHAKLDQALAGQIVEAGKGIVVVVTKSDLVEDIDEILDGLERDFNFLPFAPVLVTSSETGVNVTRLFELALEIEATRKTEVKTSELNKILAEAILEHAPAGLKNTRPKPKYVVQTDVCPPWFVVHGHDLGLLHWSWKRFFERKIRERYPMVGTPIEISWRSDDNGGRKGRNENSD